MTRTRVVVGAIDDDASVRRAARALRDAGHEVVFVGGWQSPAQLARAVVAEDAVRLVVDADAARDAVLALLRAEGVDDVEPELADDVVARQGA